jgi:eukaryotic-like serine/threonine-protein kinase
MSHHGSAHESAKDPAKVSDKAADNVHVTLDVVAGPHIGGRFEFAHHDTFLVGRGAWSHLCLSQDLHFSRHHFRIEIRPPDCYLIDLGSRNGTFVNGHRVSSVYLKDGDVISGGKTEIRVKVGAIKPPALAPTILGSISATAPIDKHAGDTDGPPLLPGNRPLSALLPPLPGYELLEELGTGSMGVVYRAVHMGTNQQVAIKLISQKQTTSEHAIQLFIREAHLLGRLDHPRIVRCLDFGYTGGQLYLVMECVPTISLQDVLANEPRSSCIRIPCAIVRQILQGLEHAHRMSIVHRDIKPENVLLFRREGKLNAKLADFGLAKNYVYAGFSQISHEGDLRGTLAFMPPELIVDCRDARPAGDIYSVGATLYYYLTRRLPFEFGTRNKLAVVLEDEPIRLEERLPSIHPKLAKIVHRAMAKEARDRFSSAAEMFSALKPFATRRRRRH